MAARIDVRPEQLQRIQRLFQIAPGAVEQELRVFVERATEHLQGEVMARTPRNQGQLSKSIISSTRVQEGLGVEGIVGTESAYAVPVELGTRPHWVSKDGRDALAEWAKQKLGVRGAEATRVAGAIAWKIRQRGSEGRFMFRDAFETNQAHLLSLLDAAIDRIEARLAGGLA